MPISCPQCKANNPPGSRFCNSYGHVLSRLKTDKGNFVKQLKIIGITMLCIVVVVVVLFTTFPPPKPVATDLARLTPNELPRFSMRRVSVEIIDSRLEAFDTVATANLLITNGNEQPARDLEVECSFYGNSKTVIDRVRRIIYEVVPAKGSIPAKDINLGFVPDQAKSLACTVVDRE